MVWVVARSARSGRVPAVEDLEGWESDSDVEAGEMGI